MKLILSNLHCFSNDFCYYRLLSSISSLIEKYYKFGHIHGYTPFNLKICQFICWRERKRLKDLLIVLVMSWDMSSQPKVYLPMLPVIPVAYAFFIPSLLGIKKCEPPNPTRILSQPELKVRTCLVELYPHVSLPYTLWSVISRGAKQMSDSILAIVWFWYKPVSRISNFHCLDWQMKVDHN